MIELIATYRCVSGIALRQPAGPPIMDGPPPLGGARPCSYARRWSPLPTLGERASVGLPPAIASPLALCLTSVAYHVAIFPTFFTRPSNELCGRANDATVSPSVCPGQDCASSGRLRCVWNWTFRQWLKSLKHGRGHDARGHGAPIRTGCWRQVSRRLIFRLHPRC